MLSCMVGSLAGQSFVHIRTRSTLQLLASGSQFFYVGQIVVIGTGSIAS
jgi:hypothetical protein